MNNAVFVLMDMSGKYGDLSWLCLLFINLMYINLHPSLPSLTGGLATMTSVAAVAMPLHLLQLLPALHKLPPAVWTSPVPMGHAAASGTSKLLIYVSWCFYIYVNTLYILHFTYQTLTYFCLYCLFVCTGVTVARRRPTVESVARMDLALIERSLATVPDSTT